VPGRVGRFRRGWVKPAPRRRPRWIDVATGVVEIGTTAYVTANAATVVSASHTPAANSLLVAYCSMGNGTGGASSLGTVTDSVGGTWTRLVGNASASGGVAEIWVKDAGASPSAQTVTYDPGGAGASGLNLIVKWYSGARLAASQPGGTAGVAGTSAYTASLTTTQVGSIVAGAFGRATDAVTVTANANTTILGQVNGSAGDTAALFRSISQTVTPGATTYGFTNTAAVTNWMALAEIIPALAGTSAPAEQPTATGSALDATVAIGANDSGADGSGSASDALASLAANAAQPSATGVAGDAGASSTATAEAPSATGSAPDGQAAVAANAEAPVSAGSAFDATVPAAVTAPAEQPTATGSAQDASVALAASAEAPGSTGAASDGSGLLGANSELSTAVGAAQSGSASLGANAEAPASVGAAQSIDRVDLAVNADAASATGTANVASADLGVVAEQPSSTGAAFDATVSTAAVTNAPAEVATATGAAGDAAVAISANPEQPTAGGTALDSGCYRYGADPVRRPRGQRGSTSRDRHGVRRHGLHRLLRLGQRRGPRGDG
jgi:hypothetical protein